MCGHLTHHCQEFKNMPGAIFQKLYNSLNEWHRPAAEFQEQNSNFLTGASIS